MKTIIYVLIIFSFLNLPSFSQTGWYQQALPVSGTMYDIEFVNNSTGFISMDTPALLKTTNGGKSWQVLNDFRIYCIDIIDSVTIYANGRRNSIDKIYRTFNLGVSWDSVSSSNDNIYKSLSFFNKDTGIVSGNNGLNNLIWKTTDRGINLQPLSFTTGFGILFFLKEKVNGEYYGWNLSSGSMSKTTNSGVNWTAPTSMINGETGDFEWLFFFNKDSGWVTFRRGTDYRIYQTKNSGVNWLEQFRDSTGIFDPTTIEASSYSKIWAGNGFWNKVHASSNGGDIWGMQVSSIFRPIYIEIIDSLNGLVGYNQLARTTDGGGMITYVGIDSNRTSVPAAFILKQNYPNPFNPQTTIEFSIKQNSFVSLILYDILGKVILKIYDNENLNSGNYKAVLDFSKKELSSGTYFYTLNISNKQSKRIFLETKKMTFIK